MIDFGRLLLLNGPNLNMLGKRDPRQYGTFTLADVEDATRQTAAGLGFGLDCYQTNHEGSLIDTIHAAMGRYDGILINAGAWTHTSYALRDALELTGLPVVEVHISDIYRREPFRRISVIHEVCLDQVVGLGLDSYRVAAEKLCHYLKGRQDHEGSGDET
ncbi:MAG: type II 3-dehydroquinate dehydratase [Clostridiaceae bacterium]|nr:type II 3-dehydroquinate dehydratase [Eubacteriales bacterium]NLB44235.1 type II 3-dehydroquinate dehydratase [Clostridiaceae bacterium]